MIEELTAQMDLAAESFRKTNARLASIIIKTPGEETFDMAAEDSEKECCHVEMLLSRPGVQVLSSVVKSGVTCASHSHIDSIEYFIVVSGVLRVAGRICHAGECVEVPAGIEHSPEALGGDCFVICVLVPPEHEYTEDARL